MFELIEAGNLEGLKKALLEIRDLTTEEVQEILGRKNGNGDGLLHAALRKNSLPMVQLLLEMGAPVNELNAEGQTALHLAVEMGLFALAAELIAFDARIDLPNNKGVTPLKMANDKNAKEKPGNVYERIAALLRTRQEWQNGAMNFRFNKVIHMIQQSFPAIAPAEGFDKVLLVGATGSGKSTLLNYLNGARYEVGLDDALAPVARCVSGEEIARTGHEMTSQTLYPQVVPEKPAAKQEYVLCDLAGLLENRGEEERICATSSIQILSRQKGNIKGIIVLLENASFDVTKGDSFKKIAIALSQILNSNPAMMDSLYFMISKVRTEPGPRFIPAIVDKIRKILKPLKQRDHLSFEDQALMFMMEQMEKHQDRIIVPNITDTGRSRSLILEKIAALKAKEPSLFNFLEHDGSQLCFNDVLETIARGYTDKYRELSLHLPNALDIQRYSQEELRARIAALNAEILALEGEESMRFDRANLDSAINTKQAAQGRNNANITALNADVTRLRAELVILGGELTGLDTPAREPLADYEKTLDKPTSYRVEFTAPGNCVLGRINSSYQGFGPFSYSLIKPKPLNYTAVDPDDGAVVSIYDFDDDARNGRYVADFKANGGLTNIKIQFYTQRRYLHAARISELRRLIAGKEEEVNTATNEINRLNALNRTLDQEIIACRNEIIEGATNVEIRRTRVQAELSNRREWLAKAQESLRVSEERQQKIENRMRELEMEIDVNQNLFAIVYEMTQTLDMSANEVIARFWQEYEERRRGLGIGIDKTPGEIAKPRVRVTLGTVGKPGDSKPDLPVQAATLFVGDRRFPGFEVEERLDLQRGWNCFDVAVGIRERGEIVRYALSEAGNEEVRALLAPEIRHAAALTAVYLNVLVDNPGAQAGVNMLPSALRTEEVRNIFNAYDAALNHAEVREASAACNDVLGFGEGRRMSLGQLREYFALEANRQSYSDVYQRFNAVCERYVIPAERAIQAFSTRRDVYETYIREYYGRQQWFAFNGQLRGERATSMVDIVARMLQARITIHVPNAPSYITAQNGERDIHVGFNGINHFLALRAIGRAPGQPMLSQYQGSPKPQLKSSLSPQSSVSETPESDEETVEGFALVELPKGKVKA